jgi:hypothetical protein
MGRSARNSQVVAYFSREDLMVNKKKVGRPQDLEDVRALERHR